MIKFLKKYKAYLLVGYAFLFLIHFGIKDYFYLTGIIFYAFPLPFLIFGMIPIVLLYWKKRIFKFIYTLVLIFLVFFWFNNYYFNYQPAKIENTHSVLFWNVAAKQDYNFQTLKEIIKILTLYF